MTSTFGVGFSDLSASLSFPGCASVFPNIFVLYLNDLSSEALSLILSILPL